MSLLRTLCRECKGKERIVASEGEQFLPALPSLPLPNEQGEFCAPSHPPPPPLFVVLYSLWFLSALSSSSRHPVSRSCVSFLLLPRVLLVFFFFFLPLHAHSDARLMSLILPDSSKRRHSRRQKSRSQILTSRKTTIRCLFFQAHVLNTKVEVNNKWKGLHRGFDDQRKQLALVNRS